VSRQVSNDRWPGERSCGHIGLRCATPISSRARCRPSADWSPTTLRSPGCTRRVHLFGSTSLPEEAFLRQAMRRLITRWTGFLGWPTLISDRDSNWNAGVHRLLETAAGRVVRIQARTPNGQASAGRRALDDRGMRGSRRVARARPSSAGTHAVGGAVSWRAQSQTPEPADRMAAHATSAWSGVRSLASAGTLSSYYRSAA
jgi:hypothetical protein